nr:hypothetical protein [Candidatus Sigynarchaeota archaeon]
MAKKNVTEGKFLGTEAPGNEEVSSGASSITLIELELSPLETQVLELAHELMEAHYIIIIRNLYSES